MDYVDYYLSFLLDREARSIEDYQGRRMGADEREALEEYQSRVLFLRDGQAHEVRAHKVAWIWWERIIHHGLVQQSEHQLLAHFDPEKTGDTPLGDAFTVFVGWFVTIKDNQLVDLSRPAEEQLPDLCGFLTPELLNEAAGRLSD